jgi:hypothetical protein
MSKPIARRLIVVLVLSALLGSPATSLAGSRSHSAARPPRAQEAAWSPLSWLWNALVSVWQKEGCHVDPYGRCIAVSRPPVDESCSGGLNRGCLDSSQDSLDKKI